MSQLVQVSIADPESGGLPRKTFKYPWLQRWMHFAYFLGNIWTWILLTFFYVLVITPIGMLVRLFSDRLRVEKPNSSWQTFRTRLR